MCNLIKSWKPSVSYLYFTYEETEIRGVKQESKINCQENNSWAQTIQSLPAHLSQVVESLGTGFMAELRLVISTIFLDTRKISFMSSEKFTEGILNFICNLKLPVWSSHEKLTENKKPVQEIKRYFYK